MTCIISDKTDHFWFLLINLLLKSRGKKSQASMNVALLMGLFAQQFEYYDSIFFRKLKEIVIFLDQTSTEQFQYNIYHTQQSHQRTTPSATTKQRKIKVSKRLIALSKKRVINLTPLNEKCNLHFADLDRNCFNTIFFPLPHHKNYPPLVVMYRSTSQDSQEIRNPQVPTKTGNKDFFPTQALSPFHFNNYVLSEH